MPNIGAELSKFKDSKYFPSLAFCAEYWQCQLDPTSYDASCTITPQETFLSTRIIHGLNNAFTYFYPKILKFFKFDKDAIKSWIDDFNIPAKSELDLLHHLKTFLKFAKNSTCAFLPEKVRSLQSKYDNADELWTVKGIS